MLSSPLRILDPELVLPAPEHVNNLRFWDRMNEWSNDNELKVGPSTMQGLSELAASPPRVDGLPQGDFWKIIGKYVSRTFSPSAASRGICEDHFKARYRPMWGADSNRGALLSDVRAAGPSGWIALSTPQECWPESTSIECSYCDSNRVAHIAEPLEPGVDSDALAIAWRQNYLSEHRSDPKHLEAYATKLFPSIEFSDSAWTQLGTLAGSPDEIVESVVAALTVLNDFAEDIWNGDVTTQGRQTLLGAHGITASPESPKTHNNSKAMKARDFSFEQGEIRCEWHTKLRPEINRVYFAVENSSVFVGAIVDHLPT